MDNWQRAGVEFIVRDSTRTGVAGVQRSLFSLDRQARDVQRAFAAIWAGLGVGAGVVGVAGLARGLRSGIGEAVNFEQQLAMVNTMLDRASGRYLPRYREGLAQMATAYGESTETLSKGLYDILSASVAPGKAMEVLAVSAQAARGGFTTTAVAADAVTTVLNSYRMSADQATRVSDVMFATVKRGKLTYEDLAQGIGHVAAQSALVGLSIEDIGAAIATMTRSGMQADIAITSLRTIINSFLKPSDEARKAARSFGLELNAATLKSLGLVGVLQKLRAATPEQIAAIIPEARGMAGFAAQLQSIEGAMADLAAITNSAGSALEAFGKATDTNAFRVSQLREQWTELKRNIGDTAPIQKVTSATTLFLNALNWEIRTFRQLKSERLDVMYKGLSDQQQASAKQSLESVTGKPFKTYGRFMGQSEFDYTSVIDPYDRIYARRLFEAYQRSAGVQATVREQIQAQVAATEAAQAAAADAAGPMYGEMLGWIEAMQRGKTVISENIVWLKTFGSTYDAFAAQVGKARLKLNDMTSDIEQQALVVEMTNQGVYRARDVLAARDTARIAYGEGTSEYQSAMTRYQQGLDRLQVAEKAQEVSGMRGEIERMDEALDRETEIIGRLNDSHERAAALVDYEHLVRQAYADDLTTQGRKIDDYRRKLEDLQTAEFVNETMDDLSGTLTDIAFDFDNAADAAARFSDALARNIVQQQVMQPMTDMLGGMIRGWILGGGQSPAGSGGYVDPGSGINTVTGEVRHSGGIAGQGGVHRTVPAALFAGAPRLHHGGVIGPGEVPIIAQRGETILPAGSGSVKPNVTVNFSNQTGASMAAPEVSTDFSLDEYIINVVLRDQQQGGPIRDNFGGRG